MGRHKEFDKTKAIDKAKELFWAQGYEATSIQDLVDHLGISRSSLYDTFSDKHTLFLFALDRYHNTEYPKLIDMFDERGLNVATIRAIFRNTVEAIMIDACYNGCFIVNSTAELALTDAEVAQRVNENRDQVEALFYQALVNSQRKGDLAAEKDPRALAHFLFNAMQSLHISAKARKDRAMLESVVEVTLSVLD